MVRRRSRTTSRWMRLPAALLVAIAIWAIARDARATSVCTWVSVPDIHFGNYTGAQNDVSNTLTFNCTANDTAVTLTMSSCGSGNSAARYFTIPNTPTFTFGVYKDAAHTQNFGLTVAMEISVATPVIGNNTVTVYATIPAGQAPATGSYATGNCANHLKFGASDLSLSNFVYANVGGTCSTSVTANLAFGAYDPIVANQATPLDGTATISVNCSNYLPYTVTLGQGANPGGGSTNAAPVRQMASGANRLGYSLYQDSGRSTSWGNTAGTGAFAYGIGSAQSATVYGRVPAGQNKPAGSYSDTVLATVTF
jgi:spore coat protein U-like protein